MESIVLIVDALIGVSILLAGILGAGLITMWLSGFYILSSWRTSHRLIKQSNKSSSSSSSSSSTGNSASNQLKKINSFISPVTTTDIVLN